MQPYFKEVLKRTKDLSQLPKIKAIDAVIDEKFEDKFFYLIIKNQNF